MRYLIDCNHPGIVFACATTELTMKFFQAMVEEGACMEEIEAGDEFPDWDVCTVEEDFNPDNFNPFYYWYWGQY